ncbi:spermine oxidase-like isoform X2 [Harmonia axyridis]|uniref:spermine oxidase-like isoform X2 n=1 Tax=Harmonia axyridis TaxID=115357 RepID=UPI001E277F15|nr:spermine oxidase-like isoform X2 [Harmonia axyridis]
MNSIKNTKQKVEDVIIVGAGAAGIAALSKLLDYGIENVKILEAENRIGGRVHSIYFGDAYVDLGAEEVHGENGNIIVELAKQFLNEKKSLTESICYCSKGNKVDKDVSEQIMKLIEDFCEDDSKVDKSIGHVFTERFSETILKKYENDPSKIKIATSFLPLCESFFSILEGPYSWFDVILESASNYVDCKGDQFIGWNGYGCKTILEIIMGKNPKRDDSIDEEIHYGNKISLGKVVKKISWNRGSTVRIECDDGSSYFTKYVIFTPSVGVLREKHKEIFEPCLPEKKQHVLQKIGYSNVMKVALRFKNKWWNEVPMALLWTEDHSEDIGNSWLKSIHWLMGAPENPNVLVAWLTGPETTSVEKLSNDEIKNGIMKVLDKFLANDFEISEPVEIIPTRWHSNPNFRGTYSYETLETCKLEIPFQKTLEEPLRNEEGHPIVLFAGEATHLTQYSTVNGAILSGYREAERIVGIRNKN